MQNTARLRIGLLREAGFVLTTVVPSGIGSCVWTTSRGARAAGVELRAPKWPGERLLHRLAVVDAAITFELGGARVLSERELRRAEATSRARAELTAAGLASQAGSVPDGRGRERFLCAPVGAEGRVHYPDLVVGSPLGLAAIEVEVTRKAPAELRQLLRSYRDARNVFQQVVYFATEPVMAVLHGHAHPRTGAWTDGVAQQVGLLPPGPPQYRADSPFLVRHFQPKDAGVAYQLDLRQVPETRWVSFPHWRELRARWEAERQGAGFLSWWQAQP
ncbi:hypothetical protein ACFVV7_33740 [Streptomyces globisporus]|uniref:hypothetical protein n=1 Tax=Streptomyces globisporus TaxID=1908 RepID=UPI0036D91519